MSFFRGPTTQITTYSGLQVQTTTSASAIPLLWGENMLTPTVIDYQGFTKKKSGSKAGGKGGGLASVFGSGETVYYASVIMAICEGPVSDVPAVYQTSWSPISLTSAGLQLQVGTLGQAPLSYWTAHYPASALGYSGIAYVWSSAYDLGPSATVGSNSLVVQGPLYGSGFNGIDADPALVISDFLTNPRYGAGFPAASLANLTGASGDSSLQSYCHAVGLAFSPILNNREAANSILDRWLQLLNCAAVWSSGALKFIPRGDQAISGNGWSFVPDLTIQANFDDDGYYAGQGDTSDPVAIARADPYDLENYLTLEIVSRGNGYNAGPIPVWDQGAMDRYGPLIKSGVSAHEICEPAIGQVSAQLMLQRGLYIRNTYTWKASWEYAALDPMDLVTLTDSRIGLAKTTVRITDIEEDDAGILTFTAEEFPLGVATAYAYPVQAATNGTPNIGVTPNAVNTPLIFEPPPALTQGALQVWAAVSPQSADPNWGGCIVDGSFDGTSYQAVTTLSGVSTMGVSTGPLAAYGGANPDVTNTLNVDLSQSGGALLSATSANAAAGSTALWIGGEILSYTTATLTAPNKYALTGLYRGLYGTSASGAASATPLALINGPLVKYTLPPGNVGQTLYLKFQSFNLFGAQVQSLSAAAAYSYTILGSGLVSGAWTSYTPTWSGTGGTAPTLGNGALSGGYYSSGQTTNLTISLTVGSTTAAGSATAWSFAAPRAAASAGVGSFLLLNGSGAQIAHGSASIAAGATAIALYDSATGLVGATTYTLATGQKFSISLQYQAS